MHPTVAVVVTRGTIDAVGRDRLDLAAYQETSQRLKPGELLARIPEVERVAHVQLVTWPLRGPASDLQSAVHFCRFLHDLTAQDIAGVVVTRGTNSLEEFAYAAQLAVGSVKPIVFVGSMRPASALSYDGDLNLMRAVQVAANPAARDHGVLVLMNDRIYSARDVTKGSTYRVDAFEGRDLGPLGFADADGRIVMYHRHLRWHGDNSPIALDQLESMPRVDIIVSHIGADGVLIDAARAAGSTGIVMAGMGAGFPTDGEAAALQRARDDGAIVCIASRVGSGRVTLRPRLADAGFVAADNLVPWKARILLAFGIAAGLSRDAVQNLFDSH